MARGEQRAPPDTERLSIDQLVRAGGRGADDSIETLAQKIVREGLQTPVVVNDQSRLIDGERWLLAMMQLDWETVPVRRYRSLRPDEQQRQATRKREGATTLDGSRKLVYVTDAQAVTVPEEERAGARGPNQKLCFEDAVCTVCAACSCARRLVCRVQCYTPRETGCTSRGRCGSARFWFQGRRERMALCFRVVVG